MIRGGDVLDTRTEICVSSVSEYELKYANNKLISDNPKPGADVPAEYRRILAGQVPGSDFYVAGGITELNYNIRSAGVDAYVGDKDTDGLKGNFRRRVFIMHPPSRHTPLSPTSKRGRSAPPTPCLRHALWPRCATFNALLQGRT